MCLTLVCQDCFLEVYLFSVQMCVLVYASSAHLKKWCGLLLFGTFAAAFAAASLGYISPYSVADPDYPMAKRLFLQVYIDSHSVLFIILPRTSCIVHLDITLYSIQTGHFMRWMVPSHTVTLVCSSLLTTISS